MFFVYYCSLSEEHRRVVLRIGLAGRGPRRLAGANDATRSRRRSVWHVQKRAAPRASRNAPNGPHDPSPRRERRRRGRKRPRTVRASRGYLPNSPSTTEFPLCAQPGSTPTSWRPQRRSGRREERQAHDATKRIARETSAQPCLHRSCPGSCPRRRRTVACAAAWTPKHRDDEMRIWKSSTTRRRALRQETTRPSA